VPVAPLLISVVVPSWQDADNLSVLLPQLARLKRVAEVIVVDATGDSVTEALAQEFGAIFLKCLAPNRGAQMNAGAMSASSEVLLFQHADTDITDAHLAAIDAALYDPEIVGGAFYRKFDDRHPRLIWLEKFARFLTRNGGTLFGDQSVFVRREVFLRLNGFAELPLMEDVEFSRRLRAFGKIVVLDPPVRSSARHHQRKGAWRTSIQNGLFILLYKLGVSPGRLHGWYYKQAAKAPPSADPAPADLLSS